MNKDNLTSPANIESQPPGQDQTRAIALILKRLIAQWKIEAAKTPKIPPPVDTAEKQESAFRIDQFAPPTESQIDPMRSSGSQDLQATIIASSGTKRSPDQIKRVTDNLGPNRDIPETIIVNSKQPIKSKQDEIIPETMIIRPAEAELLQPRVPPPGSTRKSHPTENIEENQSGKVFTYEKKGRLDNQNQTGAKSLFPETFQLSKKQVGPKPSRETPPPFWPPPQEELKPSLSDSGDELEKTIIVNPKKTDNKGN